MAAHQAPPSLGFSRQEHWSGLPCPSPMQACMLSRFSCVRLCMTLWTAAHRAPLSTGFSRQEYWSGLPFPSPWRIMTLHYCDGFCPTSISSSLRHTHAPSLLNVPPHPTPLGRHRARVWVPCLIQPLSTDCFTNGNVCVSILPSQPKCCRSIMTGEGGEDLIFKSAEGSVKF